ncbi:hypothetical protein FGO68_gene11874 [Halteria grandinella]|uniref:Uncharacterized protein n=1 Tax=Halteria grandinella TaxID=5974 RepID=A0A8J8SYH2_HALGN|nr:hypothetical protein FGO68_gene11874 [Halteria grandinella]
MNSAEFPGDKPLIIKLVMLGNQGVGKTSFLIRYFDKVFPNHHAAMGIEFRNHKVTKEGRECKYQIWDAAGANNFWTLPPVYYRGARGFLFFVDLSIKTPIEQQLDKWMQAIEEIPSENASKILIGSKCDLSQLIRDEECEKYAQKYGMTFIKTSACENVYITEPIESIMEMAFQQVKDLKEDSFYLKPRQPEPNFHGRCC